MLIFVVQRQPDPRRRKSPVTFRMKRSETIHVAACFSVKQVFSFLFHRSRFIRNIFLTFDETFFVLCRQKNVFSLLHFAEISHC